jgi:hypothetical protein
MALRLPVLAATYKTPGPGGATGATGWKPNADAGLPITEGGPGAETSSGAGRGQPLQAAQGGPGGPGPKIAAGPPFLGCGASETQYWRGFAEGGPAGPGGPGQKQSYPENVKLTQAKAANDPAHKNPRSVGATAANARAYWCNDENKVAYQDYHAHHFNCPQCIAAGRGSHYGQRCAKGLELLAICNNPPTKGQP